MYTDSRKSVFINLFAEKKQRHIQHQHPLSGADCVLGTEADRWVPLLTACLEPLCGVDATGSCDAGRG